MAHKTIADLPYRVECGKHEIGTYCGACHNGRGYVPASARYVEALARQHGCTIEALIASGTVRRYRHGPQATTPPYAR